MKLSTLAAAAALSIASCKDNSQQPSHSASATPAGDAPAAALTPPTAPTGNLHPRIAAALKAVPQTVLEIEAIAKLQQDSFTRTGEWLKPGEERILEARLLNAISKDLFNKPHQDGPGASDTLMEAVNRAGYHLYLSGTALQDKPYVTAAIYALGEPKTSSEFEETKRFLKVHNDACSMRELIKVVGTPYGDELYGSISLAGDVLVSPWSIQRDLISNGRDPKVMFQAVLANELGHLKLLEARKAGALQTNEHPLDEAYSDYCTFLITPAKETLFALFDVMATTTMRYDESKAFAGAALEAYGKRHVPAFRGLDDNASKTILLNSITTRATLRTCENLKYEILTSYKNALMAKGFPESLF